MAWGRLKRRKGMNAVVITIIVMLVLLLLRTHVVSSLIVGAFVG